LGVTGRKPEAFIGPLSSQSLKRKAIQFIMIVFTTSCAPNLALRKPGTAPHSAPPAKPPSSASGRWMNQGSPFRL
jgi:hypothetical protein